MIENSNSVLFKSKKSAFFTVFVGLALSLAYKAWKVYIKNNLGIDPSQDYYNFQSYCTYFRILGTSVAAICFIFIIKNIKRIVLPSNFKLATASLLYPVLYFLLKNSFFGLKEFLPTHFKQELFYNIFTGSFEELIFRGLILLGLVHLFGIAQAALISSLFFSVWHYDVIGSNLEYLSLFLFSLIFTVICIKGGGIIILLLIHFLYDQVHFGLVWSNHNSPNWIAILLSFNLLYLIFLLPISNFTLSSRYKHS